MLCWYAVVAHQWWWEIQYPQYQNLITANEFHIQRGRQVRFLLASADVIHSFWIPQLAGRRDMIPGKTNEATLTPTEDGEYIGECGEFCGLSHANMQFRVFVDEPADFEKWISAMATLPASPTGTAEAGAKLFAASPCTSCHAISGVSFSPLGPNLTHFGSRTTLASGTLKKHTRTDQSMDRQSGSAQAGSADAFIGARPEPNGRDGRIPGEPQVARWPHK